MFVADATKSNDASAAKTVRAPVSTRFLDVVFLVGGGRCRCWEMYSRISGAEGLGFELGMSPALVVVVFKMQ